MSDGVLVCTPVELPPGMQVAAAEAAVLENPVNKPPALKLAEVVRSLLPVVTAGLVPPEKADGFLPTPEHLAYLTTKYWGAAGVSLRVGFMESCPADLRDRIIAHANSWGEFSNVKFVYSTMDPQVRITRSGTGYWSYLGTDIRLVPRDQPTMSLQGFTMNTPESEFRRVVRHEAGHCLGSPHEHMRRELVDRIDPEKAIDYFMRTQGWSRQTVIQQVLTPLEESNLLGTEHADQESIMAYQLPASITKDGLPILGGSDFDSADRVWAAKVYPKPAPPPVGRRSATIEVDFETRKLRAVSGFDLS